MLLGIVLGFFVGIAVLYTYTPGADFNVFNEGPTGLSALTSRYSPSITLDTSYLTKLEPRSYAYLVIRSSEVGQSEVASLVDFLANGGLVIASGTPTFLNSLLKQLNVSVEVGEATVFDSIRNYGDRFHPLGYSPTCNVTISTYLPRYIIINDDAKIVAYSSEFSYVDLDGDGYMDLNEPEGPFPLVAAVSVKNGTLFVVSSPHIFTNSLLNNNSQFLDCLVSGRKLVVDQADAARDPLQYVKLSIAARRASDYSVIALVAVAGLVTYLALRER